MKFTFNDKDVKAISKKFKHPDKDSEIYTFMEISSLQITREEIEKYFILAKKYKIRCILPCFSDKISPSPKIFDVLREIYRWMTVYSSIYGIKIGIHIQSILEKSYFLLNPDDEELRAKMLTRIDYFCCKEEIIKQRISDKVLSVTAYDEEYSESLYLKDYVENGTLEYSNKDRNLMIHAYLCDTFDPECNTKSTSVNKLSYKSYMTFLNKVISYLGDSVKAAFGKEIILLYVSEIAFDTPNRRDWDFEINNLFLKKYNKDPRPYYDALFENVGDNTPSLKNCFFSVRSEMLKDGMINAIKDTANAYNLDFTYSLCESKIPACAWLFGDGMKNFEYASCALLDKAYMYGINSLRLVSSAATIYGYSDIYCDIYKNYPKISKSTFYDDALNAFSQGTTKLLTHFPEIKKKSRRRDRWKLSQKGDIPEFSKMANRCQNLLSGGHRVCDIAVLYPIESINSDINFYQSHEKKFEYPPTQILNDYMTLLNILNVNCAQNAILIHPSELLNCSVRNKKLAFDAQGIEFKMLFIPGSLVMSVEVAEKIKEFYNAGGKVAATVNLPKFASEYVFDDEKHENSFMEEYGNKNDLKLRNIIKEIFGSDATDPQILRAYFKHSNIYGGVAYYLCPSKTAADGSLYVSPSVIREILYGSGTPLDVYMSNMPKLMNTNGFSTIYPEFKGLGMTEFIPYGGIINHLHKKHGNADVYFFSNTRHEKYSGTAFLRGKMTPVFLNPFTGARKHLKYRYVNHKGYVYTAIDLTLEHGDAVFMVTRTYYEISSNDNGYSFIDNIEKAF